MSQDKFQFVSSRFVKEIGRLGGDIGHFVTPSVNKALQKKFKKAG
jgi:pantetheine-phosphate adenylyltransferase